jgi:hypothetical protein
MPIRFVGPRFSRFPAYGLVLLALGSWAVLGATAASPVIEAHRSRLELASVPGKPTQVLELVGQLKSRQQQSRSPQLEPVILIGQIGGLPNPWSDTHPDFPWFAGQASFFLLDAKVATQFADHAKSHGGDHNCVFCQRLAAKSAHAVAVVNLVDDEGATLRIDTRDLFPLREGQSVVVRGRAELLGGTMLVIHADGLQVRR